MLKKLFCTCCLLAFVFIGLTPNRAFSQTVDKHSKLEWRLNFFRLPMLDFNLGLRVNTSHAWKPDFYASYQMPFTHLLWTDKTKTGATPLLLDMRGPGFSVYGGVTRFKGDWGARGRRLTLQIGIKAYQTGKYHWRREGDDADCGDQDKIKVTMGPRILWNEYFPISKRIGVELFGGVGARFGFTQYKVYNSGTAYNNCYTYYPTGQPPIDWGRREFTFAPAIHAGLSLVLR
jgi:hypothetical protein